MDWGWEGGREETGSEELVGWGGDGDGGGMGRLGGNGDDGCGVVLVETGGGGGASVVACKCEITLVLCHSLGVDRAYRLERNRWSTAEQNGKGQKLGFGADMLDLSRGREITPCSCVLRCTYIGCSEHPFALRTELDADTGK